MRSAKVSAAALGRPIATISTSFRRRSCTIQTCPWVRPLELVDPMSTSARVVPRWRRRARQARCRQMSEQQSAGRPGPGGGSGLVHLGAVHVRSAGVS